jgi:hypothetical protein
LFEGLNEMMISEWTLGVIRELVDAVVAARKTAERR